MTLPRAFAASLSSDLETFNRFDRFFAFECSDLVHEGRKKGQWGIWFAALGFIVTATKSLEFISREAGVDEFLISLMTGGFVLPAGACP